MATKKKDDHIGLWRLNRISGLWTLERKCDPATAKRWLEVFQSDDPNSVFKLSKTKPAYRKMNPARKTSARKPAAKRAYVNRPSQATKKPPTKRLKARRAANVRGSGMFPNPKPRFQYLVHVVAADGVPAYMLAGFREKKLAVEYARAYADKTGSRVGIEKKPL